MFNYPNGAGYMDYDDVDPDFVAHQRKKQLFVKRVIQLAQLNKNENSRTP